VEREGKRDWRIFFNLFYPIDSKLPFCISSANFNPMHPSNIKGIFVFLHTFSSILIAISDGESNSELKFQIRVLVILS